MVLIWVFSCCARSCGQPRRKPQQQHQRGLGLRCKRHRLWKRRQLQGGRRRERIQQLLSLRSIVSHCVTAAPGPGSNVSVLEVFQKIERASAATAPAKTTSSPAQETATPAPTEEAGSRSRHQRGFSTNSFLDAIFIFL